MIENPRVRDDFACPECGSPVERFDWWDDPAEAGGWVIGWYDRCVDTRCSWDEYY